MAYLRLYLGGGGGGWSLFFLKRCVFAWREASIMYPWAKPRVCKGSSGHVSREVLEKLSNLVRFRVDYILLKFCLKKL